MKRPIAHLIVTVDRHKRHRHVAESHSSVNPFQIN